MKRALLIAWLLIGIPALTLGGFLVGRRFFIEEFEQGARLGESSGGCCGAIGDIIGGAAAAFAAAPALVFGPLFGSLLVAFLLTRRGAARARAFFTR